MVSHTASGDWQSFESRMRRRRAERLALRADVAADAGCHEDAQTCLDEARALAPGMPELAAIEAKLSRPRRRPVSASVKWSIVAACLVAFVGGLATTRTVPAATGGPTVSQLTPISDARAGARPAATVVVRTEAAFVADAAPTVRPASLAAKPEREAGQPEREENARPIDPEPAVRAVAPAVSTERAAPLAFTAVNGLPAPSVPAPAPVAMVPVEVPELVPTPPAAAPPVAEPPQESVVRAVLGRYASAYSALDATAAQQVWPGVNRAALARAFDNLASQQISLGDCRIDVAASNAHARCAGSATWSPKVGGGSPRTEARDWTFELARAASGWQIVRARVQNR